MEWCPKTYKLIKSIKPMELWDILTQGICDNHRDTIIKEIKEISPWLLDNWGCLT